MAEVIRFSDYERKSRDADAVSPRDPADSAIIIVLPVIRLERYAEPSAPARGRKLPSVFLSDEFLFGSFS